MQGVPNTFMDNVRNGAMIGATAGVVAPVVAVCGAQLAVESVLIAISAAIFGSSQIARPGPCHILPRIVEDPVQAGKVFLLSTLAGTALGAVAGGVHFVAKKLF